MHSMEEIFLERQAFEKEFQEKLAKLGITEKKALLHVMNLYFKDSLERETKKMGMLAHTNSNASKNI